MKDFELKILLTKYKPTKYFLKTIQTLDYQIDDNLFVSFNTRIVFGKVIFNSLELKNSY
jgi:hypothetical protein